MADDDHLDKDISIAGELTQNGVTLKAKSRTTASLDRLVGNVGEWLNVSIEERTAPRRGRIEAKKQLIAAATKALVAQVEHDPDFAVRALGTGFERMFRAHENREGVAAAALDDLNREPPSDEDAACGPEVLDEEFVSKFETYADGASTEQLRERWGRVLAAEVRKPGTFSSKTLRTVDELSTETARIFEEFASHRLSDTVPKYFLPEDLTFHHKTALVDAGLLVDPGLTGHQRYFGDGQIGSMDVWTIWAERNLHITLIKDGLPEIAANARGRVPLTSTKVDDKFVPAIPIYLLTGAGNAIASILPPADNSVRMLEAVRTVVSREKAVLIAYDELTQQVQVLPF